MRSFSLVEVLLVIAILVALSVVLVPLGFDYYKSQQLDASTKEILQTLRRAQSRAMSLEMDSRYGVYITDDNYILFKGDSYIAREDIYDEVFTISPTITITDPPKEIVFSKYEGIPDQSLDIVLTNSLKSKRINVTSFGMISQVSLNPPYVAQASFRFRNDDGGE